MIITSYSDIHKDDSTLRPYQQKAKKEIFESWDEVDNVMLQMPTGTGKTKLFTSIIRDINDHSIQRKEAVKILIIAHRTELIDQISEHLKRYEVAHSFIAGSKERNLRKPVLVASIQTITNSHNREQAEKLNIQFIIIDEAHHALAKSYKKLWDMYPGAKRLGVTATPWRMNHQSFLDLFNKLVMSMPIKDFIKQGYLAPYKYFSLRDDSDIQKTIDGIELNKYGEYEESSMEEKMDIGSIRAQLLKSYLSLAEGKKGIIYAINIKHARNICEEYQEAGYRVVSIDSNTPSEERKDLVKKFKRGEIDIIVNVDIFSEGFDCPDIEFIQLARPTCSLVKYLQQVGRGLRPTENKQNCVILDNVGMYSKFGLPDARRHWNYHFKGKAVVEEPTKYISRGTGKSRFVDLSEGTEDMELIQDVNDIVENNDVIENIPLKENVATPEELFDPIALLQANHFECNNLIFYFKNSKRIYETYIQNDEYFIISELQIDNVNHCVHRIRVGKIPSDSWMFWQLLREKIDHLKAITHYGGKYTLFHYRVMSTDRVLRDKYFDYKGREIFDPESVKTMYDQAISDGGQTGDFKDIPVSKASFNIVLDNNSFTVYRTLKGGKKPIAKMLLTSTFGISYIKELEIENKERVSKGMPEIKSNNTNWLPVLWSDENSFTVRMLEKGKAYLIKYDFKGNLKRKESIVGDNKKVNYSISKDDQDLLSHVFDKVATSYKFFWFMSILQIYKEKQEAHISFRQLMVRMVANAWNYVYDKNGRFSQLDRLPYYLDEIKPMIKLKGAKTISQVEEAINSHPRASYIYTLLRPLMTNVPYRFLSPWISFTDNDDVIEKSHLSQTRCPYELYNNYIVINELWKGYLFDHYLEMILFVETGLMAHLKLYTPLKDYVDFYDRKYDSLSQLCREIQERRGMEFVKTFITMHNLHITGKITPRDIIDRIPKSKWITDKDGRKVLDVPKGAWSLKLLDQLLTDS